MYCRHRASGGKSPDWCFFGLILLLLLFHFVHTKEFSNERPCFGVRGNSPARRGIYREVGRADSHRVTEIGVGTLAGKGSRKVIIHVYLGRKRYRALVGSDVSVRVAKETSALQRSVQKSCKGSEGLLG